MINEQTYITVHACVSGAGISIATIATDMLTHNPLLVLVVLGLSVFACYRHLKYKLAGFGLK